MLCRDRLLASSCIYIYIYIYIHIYWEQVLPNRMFLWKWRGFNQALRKHYSEHLTLFNDVKVYWLLFFSYLNSNQKQWHVESDFFKNLEYFKSYSISLYIQYVWHTNSNCSYILASPSWAAKLHCQGYVGPWKWSRCHLLHRPASPSVHMVKGIKGARGAKGLQQPLKQASKKQSIAFFFKWNAGHKFNCIFLPCS